MLVCEVVIISCMVSMVTYYMVTYYSHLLSASVTYCITCMPISSLFYIECSVCLPFCIWAAWVPVKSWELFLATYVEVLRYYSNVLLGIPYACATARIDFFSLCIIDNAFSVSSNVQHLPSWHFSFNAVFLQSTVDKCKQFQMRRLWLHWWNLFH